VLAETLIKAGRWEEAEAAGQEAVSLCTQLPASLQKERFYGPLARALERLAFVQKKLNKLDSALESYNKSLKLDPSCVSALTNRATVHEKLGHKDEALADLKKAVELAPSVWGPYHQLAVFYWGQRQFEAAAQACAKVIELDPEGGMGYGNRGATLFYLGRYDEALADLTHGLKLGPKDPYVNSALAWLLVAGPPEIRDPQRAAAIAESGLVRDNEKTKILGGASLRLGQYPQAKKALTDAVQLTDESSLHQFAERLLFLTMACEKLGDHQEAQKWFAQAEGWIKANAGPEDIHLQAIREEAAALLGGPMNALQPEREP
jgi:tetratricopeptide (TPR) repeat protein